MTFREGHRRRRGRIRAAARTLFAGGVVLAAIGCEVDQNAEVAKYRSILDQHIKHVDPPAEDEKLTLELATALANQLDENLASRGEDYVQSLIARNRALANFLPTVSFQPSFVVAQPATGAAIGGISSGNPVNTASVNSNPNTASLGPVSTGFGETSVTPVAPSQSLTESTSTGTGAFRQTDGVLTRLEAPVVGSINLFRGFGDVANVQVAKWDIKRQRELMLDLQATLMLNVAQGYYQVLRSEAQAHVLRDSLFVQETRVQLIHDQFDHKLATKLDVAQSEAQADATRVQLIQSESDVQNARSTLAFLIGVTSVTGPLADDFSAPDAGPLKPWMDDALRTRRDLLAAQYNTKAGRRAVDVYIAQYYPSVSLNVAGFLYREYFSDASKWDAVLSANLPIFSAGLIEADVRAAWSRLRQAALAEEYLRRSVRHDVELAYQNLSAAEKRIHALQGEVDAAQEAYRQAQNGFANGLAINLDVLTAQNQLLNAQLQLTSAKYDRVIYYLDLRRVSGRMNP